MGTRADFYLGRGNNAEWLGSIACDGYPDDGAVPAALISAVTEDEYRKQVELLLSEDDSATCPKQGWPWPWKDSRTTDYAYAFDDGRVWACPFGYFWWPASEPEPEIGSGQRKVAEFPDMTTRQRVALDGRSGLLILSVKP